MLIKEGQMHEVLLILRSPEGKFSSADAHTAPGLCQVSSAVGCELKEGVKMQGIFFVWVLEWAEFDESLLSAHWRSQCRAGVIGNFGLKGRKSIMETPLQPVWLDTLCTITKLPMSTLRHTHTFQMNPPFTSTFQLCPFAVVLKQLHQATEHVITFFSPIKIPIGAHAD